MSNDSQTEVTLEGLAIRVDQIRTQVKAADAAEVIRMLGSLLFTNGYVKDTFVEAVLEREAKFPTGLQTQTLAFAIPHTDTEHVLKPAIAVATLEQPVVFKAMGTEDAEVKAEIVIMLAISDPAAVVHVLRSVISIAENEPTLQAIRRAGSPQEVKELIYAHIRATVTKMDRQSIHNSLH